MQWLTCRLSKSQSTISLSLTWQKLKNLTKKHSQSFWCQVTFDEDKYPFLDDLPESMIRGKSSLYVPVLHHLNSLDPWKYQRNPGGFDILYTIRTDLVVFDEAFVKPGKEFRLGWQDVQQKKHLRERNQSEVRYVAKQKKRYYLGIFPKRRTPPPLLGTPYPKTG